MSFGSPHRGSEVLITGASSGIGEAIATKLAADGYRVVAAARRIARLQALAQRLAPNCLAIELDVADSTSTGTLLDRLPEVWRNIDFLVNNAGHDIFGKSAFESCAFENWAAIIETNIIGMMRVTHALVPGMIERGAGHIVNIGSTAGIAAYPHGAAYIASKFAVNGFSSALRLEYQGKIKVTQVLPGVVRTEFDEVRRHGDKKQAAVFYAGFSQCLNPDDVANCVAFALRQPRHVNIAEMLVLPFA